MNKLPVFRTFGRALGFSIGSFGTIFRLSWLPFALFIAASLIAGIFVEQVIHGGKPMIDPLSIGAHIKDFVFLNIVMIVLQAIAVAAAAVSIHRVIHFGDRKPGVWFNFPFGTTEFLYVLMGAITGLIILAVLAAVIAPVILSGSTVIVVASEKFPLPAVTFSEILATSDLPGGVVNLLTGKRAELAPHIASHMDVNAIVDGSCDAALGAQLQAGSAINLKRYAKHALSAKEWFSAKGEDAYRILDTVEFKTAWHPIGL